MRFFHQAKWDSSKQEGKLLYPTFFHRFFVNSNFHLLGVGAEESSLYRLGFLGFDADLIIMKRGRFDKGAFQPFCWIVGPQPRPIE